MIHELALAVWPCWIEHLLLELPTGYTI